MCRHPRSDAASRRAEPLLPSEAATAGDAGGAGDPKRGQAKTMRTTVRVGGTIAASPKVLFACVADYEQAPMFIDGLVSLAPAGRRTRGKGAKFDAVMKVGPKTFSTTIEIAELEENHLVTWSSASDNGQSVTFELRPDGDGTQVVLEIEYERPGGLAGVVTGRVVEETVKARAHTSMRKLRDHLS